MASRIAWLDASADEQRRVREVVQLFSQRETLDEMGGRRIVVALADELFPGTSQLQSRARYVLMVPWLCQLAARSKKNPSGQLDWLERSLIKTFLDPATDLDHNGLVGSSAGPQVKTLPSTMYWTGLQRWGVLTWPGTIDQTLERMARLGRTNGSNADTGDLDELAERQTAVWHAGVGRTPTGFPDDLHGGFSLTYDEAEWLRERWLATTNGSMLAHLVRRAQPLSTDVWAPWQDPACQSSTGPIRGVLDEAERFALAVDGARLLYNLLVAERYLELGHTATAPDLDEYRAAVAGWSDEARARHDLFEGWDRVAFWAFVRSRNARVDDLSRRFFDTWLERLERADVDGVAQDEDLRRLAVEREWFLKRGQARLTPGPTNDKMLAAWRGGSSGRVSYRWTQVTSLVTDVLDGLEAPRVGA